MTAPPVRRHDPPRQPTERTMMRDAQGHDLSGATRPAAASYDEAVRAYNIVYGDAVGLYERAYGEAGDFAMAYLGRAWSFTVANDPVLRIHAAALLETARGLKLNEREAAHVAALSHLC